MLKAHKIDIKTCRAQAYNGASAMASEAIGASAVIKGQQPMASSIHCGNHCINLVIAFACKSETVSKFMDDLTSICYYFPTHLKGSNYLSGSSIFIKMICQFQNQIEACYRIG